MAEGKGSPSLGKIRASIEEVQNELRQMKLDPADQHYHTAALNFLDGLKMTVSAFCLRLSDGQNDVLETIPRRK